MRIALCLALVFSLVSWPAQGAEVLRHPTTGQEGVWISKESADRLLHDVGKLKEARDLVTKQDERIKLQDDQNRNLQLRLAETSSIAQAISQRADVVQRAYEEEVERSNSIWREPVLWFVLGVALGGGAAVAGAVLSTR
jgi:hypothetical protein